ncbi:MAG: hypothetical protein CFK52_12020 [Chloracidobacterium sp. CP2_5A]|nr:MAG: hypothetical protein CFK52_12020 [Chloracidobacterium sp. CP2_5A]
MSEAVIEGAPAPVSDCRPRPTLRQFGLACFILGSTAFGGGAMIVLLEDRFTRRYRWLRAEDFLEAVALAQSLPGAIATNTVAFVGYRLYGALGASLGMALYALPSFALILLLATLYERICDIPSAGAAFTGLNAAAAGLVAVTAARLGRQAISAPWQLLQAVTVFAFATLFPEVALHLILLSLLGGLLVAMRQTRRALATALPAAYQGEASRSLRKHLLVAAGIGLAVAGVWLAGHSRSDPFIQRVAQLALVTLKVGGLTFGGGFVIIPLLGHEVADVHGWLAPKEVADAAALGLLTPGPFVIAAAFIGYRVAGLVGAGVAALGIFGIPLWLVILTAGAVERFRQNPLTQGALQGVMPTGVALLAAAAVAIGKGAYGPAPHTWLLAPVLGVASAWLAEARQVNPMFLLFGGAVIGLLGSHLAP